MKNPPIGSFDDVHCYLPHKLAFTPYLNSPLVVVNFAHLVADSNMQLIKVKGSKLKFLPVFAWYFENSLILLIWLIGSL